MRFALDSNILVYAHDRREIQRRDAALRLIDGAARADCVLLLQSLAEFYKVATGKLRIAAPDARGAVRAWSGAFPVHAASESTLALAMELDGEHGVSFWDAMLVAAAREAGCGALLSEDMQDGRQVAGVLTFDPFVERNAGRLAQLLANS